jgi:hypothetical protein
MPQIATIALTQADAGTIDFNVSKKGTDTVWFRNTSESSTSAGQREFSVLWSASSPSRKTNKSIIRYASPKEHTVDDVVVVDDIARFSCDFRIPETFTAAEREDFIAESTSLLGNALVQAMLEDAEALY